MVFWGYLTTSLAMSASYRSPVFTPLYDLLTLLGKLVLYQLPTDVYTYIMFNSDGSRRLKRGPNGCLGPTFGPKRPLYMVKFNKNFKLGGARPYCPPGPAPDVQISFQTAVSLKDHIFCVSAWHSAARELWNTCILGLFSIIYFIMFPVELSDASRWKVLKYVFLEAIKVCCFYPQDEQCTAFLDLSLLTNV